MKFFYLLIILTLFPLKLLAASSSCGIVPIRPQGGYYYFSLFPNPQMAQDFRVDSFAALDGDSKDGFMAVAPAAFLDINTAKLHRLEGKLLKGTQDGKTVYYLDNTGKLQTYDVTTEKSTPVSNLNNKKISDCLDNYPLTGEDGGQMLGHLCRFTDGKGVIVLGNGRTVDLDESQYQIAKSSNENERQLAADGNIYLRDGSSGFIIIDKNNKVQSENLKNEQGNKLLWVLPDGASIEVHKGENGKGGVFIRKGNQLTQVHSMHIPENASTAHDVYKQGNFLLVKFKPLNKLEVVRIDLNSLKLEVMPLDEKLSQNGMIITRSNSGPYVYGADDKGQLQRISMSTFKPLTKEESAKRSFSYVALNQRINGNVKNFFPNKKLYVEISGGNLRWYDTDPKNLGCVAYNPVTIKMSKTCPTTKKFDKNKCEKAAKLKLNAKKPLNEDQVVQWMAVRSQGQDLDLATDMDVLGAVFASEFPVRYPQLTQAVLRQLFLSSSPAYNHFLNLHNKLKNLEENENSCQIDFSECQSDKSLADNEEIVKRVMAEVMNTGEIALVKLFTPHIEQLPSESKQIYLQVATYARINKYFQNVVKENKFEKRLDAIAEVKLAMGIGENDFKEDGLMLSGQWSCPSSLIKAPDHNIKFEVPYLPHAKSLDYTKLNQLKQHLKEFEDTDFTPCLARLNQSLVQSLGTHLSKLEYPQNEAQSMMKQLQAELQTFTYLYAKEQKDKASYLVPDQKIKPAANEKMLANLSNQLLNCNFPNSEYLLDSAMFSSLERKSSAIQKLPANCRKQLEKNYLELINSTLMSGEQCRKNPSECQFRTSKAADAIVRLGRTGIIDDKSVLKLAQGSCDRKLNSTNFLNSLFELDKNVQKVSKCTELKKNESMQVSHYQLVHGHYGLKRLNDKDYEVELKLRFVDVQTGNSRGAKANDMFKHVQSCFGQYSHLMVGPNGEKLNFKFTQAFDEGGRDVRTINIQDKMNRANSANYPTNVSCSTVLHEVFHLLGLVDEYHEHSDGYNINPLGQLEKVKSQADLANYDCRTVGPKDSLMSSHITAIKAEIPKKNARGQEYRSLLYPAHFRFITRPMCDQFNRKYLACGGGAYQSSVEIFKKNYGKISGRAMCAPGLPKYCSDGSGEWLK